jgi:hypothetical protein
MAKALTNVRNELTGTAERPTVTIRGSSKTLSLVRPTAARRRRRLYAGGATIAVISAALAMWIFGPWRGKGSGTVATRPSASAAAPAAATVSSAAIVAPVAARDESPRSVVPPTRPNAAVAAPGVITQDSMVRAVRTNIVGNRRRALDAGATASELASGDSLLGAADVLIARGRGPEAVQQLSMASVRWIDAERSARDRVARDRSAPAAEHATVAAPLLSVPASSPPAPVSAPSAEKASGPTAAAAPVDPRPEIERVIAAYSRAIESGSVDEIRRVYPGITAAQQQQWNGFFRSVRNFKARLAVDQLSVAGANAETHISAVYAYESRSSGQADRQNLTLQATLTRDASGWRLTSIR